MTVKRGTESHNEIDLLEIINLVWSKRIFILKIVCVFLVLGFLVAFTSRIEFEASCKLLPEIQEATIPDLGGLGGLAGITGLNFNSKTSTITPELYPELISSLPFVEELINYPVYFQGHDTTITSLEFFKYYAPKSLIRVVGDYTIGLPNKIKKYFRSESIATKTEGDIKKFSPEEWLIYNSFSERFSITVDNETGIVRIKSEMPDARASAEITVFVVEILTTEITKYKTEKAKRNLKFIEERYNEAKDNYEEKQDRLARYEDANRNITGSIFQAEYKRLQNELDIAFEVYKSLATQLENAKIKVKEETPVFTVIEPVTVPLYKTKPQRKIIIAISLVLGIFFGVSFIIVRDYYKKFMKSYLNT